MSYTVSTSYIYTVPVCPTVQFLSLCRLHLQSFFQNINACIRIPVMNCMAFRALPDTNAQIFYPWISVAARAAGLTARIHHWYSLNFISIPAGFIFQHFEKLCPGNTCYGFCQFMVPDHSCLLYTSPSPRDRQKSRMPSSA